MNFDDVSLFGSRHIVPIHFHPAWPGWLRRAVRDENVLLFLLGVRWLSLLPPALMVLLDWQNSGLTAWLALIFALSVNVALSLWHQPVDRAVKQRPWLLGMDLLTAAALLAATGGGASPYELHALTPVLAAAFFFGVQGGLSAALFWSTCYAVLGALWPDSTSWPTRLAQMLGSTVIALALGYSSALLQRLRAANDELNHANDDLQRITALAALGKTTAHLSHEIRNPLTTLGGFARQLTRSPDDVETVRHHAQIIASECARLEALLNDVLLVARPPHVGLREGNLLEVLDRAVLLAGGARVNIVKDNRDCLPLVPMNEPALLRALLNILRNAVQVIPAGGRVVIATQLSGQNDAVTISITDNGPGLPPEIADTIFNPFVTGREGGTGLGLAIARHVAEEHGGSLSACNSPEGGARFILTLPLRSTG